MRQAAIDAGKQEIQIARKGTTDDDNSLTKEIEAQEDIAKRYFFSSRRDSLE